MLIIKLPIEQNRCAMACQGCGAAILFNWIIYEEIIVLGIKDPSKGIPIYYGLLATLLYVSAIVLVGICSY